jgi:hypothetical protein
VDNFSPGPLDPSVWAPFREGNFRDSAIEAIGGLRIAADTRGTPPGTWQHLGVRRIEAIAIRDGTAVAVSMSGGDSPFLWGAMVFSTCNVPGNPKATSDWIAISWGEGRMRVTACAGAVDRVLVEKTAENPQRRVEIRFRAGGFHLFEGDTPIFDSASAAVGFDLVYLYLMVSSESNYLLRAVRFHNLEIRP